MKQVTLRAFYINSSDFIKSETELLTKLKEKLVLRDKVDLRRMSLGNTTKDEDVLAYYDYLPKSSNNFIFGTIVRIALGNNVAHITDNLLNSKSFTLSDLKSDQLSTSAIYKSHYYFFISDKYVITNLASNSTISRLQTYLRWLVEDFYELTPVIDQDQARRVADIKKITMQDPIHHVNNDRKDSQFLLKQIGTQALRKIFSDTKNINDLELQSIISAKLVLEIDKPDKSNSASIQKFYGACLKPVSDLENILLTTRDNQNIITGKDLLKNKIVQIDMDDQGNLNEKNLSQEMHHFILELEHEEKNNS